MTSPDRLSTLLNGDVPRRIWTLWIQGPDHMPAIPRACIDSWRRSNPGWDVKLLTAANLCEWADPVLCHPKAQSLRPEKLSNLARLNLLATRGGVWVDATCYCMRPLDDWLPGLLGSGFFAFERPGPDRLISSWFLAGAPDGHIQRRMWSELRSYYLNHSPSDDGWRRFTRGRLERVANRNSRTTRLWFLPPFPQLGIMPYHSFHYMFNRLTRTDPTFHSIWQRTAKVSADGPHRLQSHGLGLPPSPEILAEIEQRSVPVYKLNWRVDPATVPASSTLNVLLAQS